jgi:tetratricopeptide (TPR) repeat protein
MDNIFFSLKENQHVSSNNETISKNTTLCLNMIVKNEGKIILRLLESISSIIDSYCICDTGSTDNTIEIIKQFFDNRKISGKIIQEPFRDFGYNRSFALKSCEGMKNADYILLLDADMIFWINPSTSPIEFKNSLSSADAFYIYQGTDSFYYKNTRIVRNNCDVKYWGVTHEFTMLPDGFRNIQLPKQLVFINDIGDGGAKADKYERDIRLLQKGLVENPNNARYLFYLANSYMNAGHVDDAIKIYKKRIDAGNWIEEVWYSYYNIGKLYKEKKNDMASAIWWWLEGFNRFPNRIEQLYEIIKYYRERGNNELAYTYYELANRMRTIYPDWDYLFMEKDIYDFKLDYEFSIIGYYCNPRNENLSSVSMKVLSDPKADDAIIRSTFSNYKFYSQKYMLQNVLIDNLQITNEGLSFFLTCILSFKYFFSLQTDILLVYLFLIFSGGLKSEELVVGYPQSTCLNSTSICIQVKQKSKFQ